MSRITPGTIIVGIFAILFGLVGAYAAQRYLQPPPEPVAEEKPAEPMFRVPQASIDLTPGRPLTLGDVAIVSYSRKQLEKLDLPPLYMTNPQQIIGRILREPVKRGEAFTTALFYPEGQGPSVAERLEPGLRAVTIPVQGTGVLNGLASSGTRVDILFRTFANEAMNIPATTVTLLEDVEVLAVGQNAIPNAHVEETASAVTLAVSPRQANALKIVEGQGDFSLALRSAADNTFADNGAPQTIHQLLGIAPKQKPFTTEVWRGGQLQSVTFEDDRFVEQKTVDLPVVRSSKPDVNSRVSVLVNRPGAEPASQTP
ncbi:MAG: Flp pilus assembly protein CpaB [Pirellulaceae bacterium]